MVVAPCAGDLVREQNIAVKGGPQICNGLLRPKGTDLAVFDQRAFDVITE
jgi:hypothetical protein